MTDRCILVTGASRGIGRAIALRLARDGFDIAVHCRSRRDLAEAVVAEIEALGRHARVLEFDVADRRSASNRSTASIGTLWSGARRARASAVSCAGSRRYRC